MAEAQEERDHLFVSYAVEDAALAEWLTLRLTAEGYRVWCDRFQLLGGESYPRDIDDAIKARTFRVLALLSRNSIDKPNPRKERTLALNLARERGEDFLIPINVDGLRATDLDWMTSDLTFIPFDPSWATGLAQVLKKLQAISAPRPLSDGAQLVSGILVAQNKDCVVTRPETLWTNLLEFRSLPVTIFRSRLDGRSRPEWLGTVPRVDQGDIIWTFADPKRLTRNEALDWRFLASRSDYAAADAVKGLLHQYFRRRCIERGMRLTPDERDIYYPGGLLPDDKVRFTTYTGRRTYVQVVGQRTYRSGATTSVFRYHLAPDFRPRLGQFRRDLVDMQLHLYITDPAGHALDAKAAHRRRRRMCKSWWNHHWLSRNLAVLSWLVDGGSEIVLLDEGKQRIAVSARPIMLESAVGIDEDVLNRAVDDEPPSEENADEGILEEDDRFDECDEEADNDAGA